MLLLQDEVTIKMAILDANDNAPVFSNSSYQWKVSEGAGGIGKTLSIAASDKDLDENAKIDFLLLQGNENANFLLKPSAPDQVS